MKIYNNKFMFIHFVFNYFNREKHTLEPYQISYGANDAFYSLKLYLKLSLINPNVVNM